MTRCVRSVPAKDRWLYGGMTNQESSTISRDSRPAAVGHASLFSFGKESPQNAGGRQNFKRVKRRRLTLARASQEHIMDNAPLPLASATDRVEELLVKARLVGKGKTASEAGIEPAWLRSYGAVARRCRDDQELGVSRYPFQLAPRGVSPFIGGFFPHMSWDLRVDLEKQASMRPIAQYECNYVNATGYWLAFNKAAISLRQEAFAASDVANAELYDCWGQLSVEYALNVLGLRCEFYRLAARDPVQAKMVLPALERRTEVAFAADLEEPLERLDSHMATQLMKAVATLHASNATKRSKKGGDGNGQ